jgi:2-amino-4-hydroxy-6-hydroxymethyldihydropteridine diphosphokinase
VTRAFIAIGSNLGDRARLLAQAVARLHAPPEIAVAVVSSVYETAPVGLTTQPDFLNAVVAVDTTLPPGELLARCLAIETALGRERRERWGPRTIDLDVLLYGDIQLTNTILTLPHPRMAERAFVLVPLAEIAPRVALGGETVAERAERLDHAGLRKIGPLSAAVES